MHAEQRSSLLTLSKNQRKSASDSLKLRIAALLICLLTDKKNDVIMKTLSENFLDEHRGDFESALLGLH